MACVSDPTSGSAPDPNRIERTFVGGKKSGGSSPSEPTPIDSNQRRNSRQGGRRLTDETPEAKPSDRYQELEEIGRGGCGVVIRAYDRRMRRDVVIKRVLPTAAASRETIARFLNEARITGRLEHPGIVPVHEIGATHHDEMPFYVMKWLKGETLSVAIREYHAEKSAAEKRRKLHELLNRFSQVCQTLAYAHQKRVVHRDIKPANIMLGQFGETIVLDWGLAKDLSARLPSKTSTADEWATLLTEVSLLRETVDQGLGAEPPNEPQASSEPPTPSSFTDSEFMTKTGSVMGTATYMSPEQARGAQQLVGPASDVFSLGVVLYEILSGVSPFRTTSLAMTLSRVAQAKYEPLRKLDRNMPRGLCAVCERAMQLDPAARYRHAGELAEEINNYLAGNAVSAFREPWWAKLDRLAGKHMVLVRSSFIALCSISAISLVGIAKVDQARRLEKSAHTRSLEQLRSARRSVDAWLVDLSGDLQFYPGMDSIRRELLQRAEQYYAANIASMNDSKAEILERAMAMLRLGDIARLSGQPDDARGQYAAALAQLKNLLDNSPKKAEPEVAVQYANALLGLALCDLEAGIVSDEVEELSRRACQAAERARTSDPDSLEAAKTSLRSAQCRSRIEAARSEHTSAAEQLVAPILEAERQFSAASSPSEFRLLIGLIHDQARYFEAIPDVARAAGAYRKLERLYTERLEHMPSRPDNLEARSQARVKLGKLLSEQSDPHATMRLMEEAEGDLQEAWNLLYDDSFFCENFSVVQAGLAACLLELGDHPRAEALLRASIERLQSVIRRDGSNLQRIASMASYFIDLAECLPDRTSSEFDKLLRDAEKLVQHLRDKGVADETWQPIERKRQSVATR